jgi:hypothetical protein
MVSGSGTGLRTKICENDLAIIPHRRYRTHKSDRIDRSAVQVTIPSIPFGPLWVTLSYKELCKYSSMYDDDRTREIGITCPLDDLGALHTSLGSSHPDIRVSAFMWLVKARLPAIVRKCAHLLSRVPPKGGSLKCHPEVSDH